MYVKNIRTVEEYIKAAVATARFERIEDGRKVYAEIPGFQGVWAEGHTRQEAREQLRQVLRGWIELQLERQYALPAVKGMRPDQFTFA